MSANTGGRPRKVPKLLEKYDLEGYGTTLCELWTRKTNRYSVRELEVKFSGWLIQAAVVEMGGEIDVRTAEDYYQNLSSDETVESKKRRIRDRLEEFGVDVESLETDFVSYHGIYTYLRSQGATPGGESDADDPEVLMESALQVAETARKTAVDELISELKQLSNVGVISETSPKPRVVIKVTCAYCERVHPLHATAAGKAILSAQPDERLDELPLEEYTDETITDRDVLREEIAQVREIGVAYNDNEKLAGLRAVACPIRVAGRIIGAISVGGPAERIRDKEFEEELPSLLRGVTNEIELNLSALNVQ